MVPAVFVFSAGANLGDGGSIADGTRAAAAARVTREGALDRIAACRVPVALRVAIVGVRWWWCWARKNKRVASGRTRRDHVVYARTNLALFARNFILYILQIYCLKIKP